MMERCTIRGKEYLIYEIESEKTVDIVGIRMLENNSIKGLMPFKFVHEEERDYYRYDTISAESLADWLQQKRTKAEVMKLMESILQVYEEIPTYLLNKEQLLTQMTEISVLEGKCLFAYIPAQQWMGEEIELFQKILSQIKYPIDEDYSYIFDLQNAYGRGEIRTLSDVKKWLKIVNGELMSSAAEDTPAAPVLQPAAVPEPVAVQAEQSEQPSKPVQKSEEVNDIFAEFGIALPAKAESKEKDKKEKPEKDKKNGLKFFGRKKMEAKPEEQEIEQKKPDISNVPKPVVINDLNRGNKTVLMDYSGTDGQPVLIRDKNRQEFRLNTAENLIGSDNNADIWLGDNHAISRRHARLFVRNGDYYVEDLGSTNGTCVNGEVLSPHMPCVLRDMAHIKISDETFTFLFKES